MPFSAKIGKLSRDKVNKVIYSVSIVVSLNSRPTKIERVGADGDRDDERQRQRQV